MYHIERVLRQDVVYDVSVYLRKDFRKNPCAALLSINLFQMKGCHNIVFTAFSTGNEKRCFRRCGWKTKQQKKKVSVSSEIARTVGNKND